MKIRLHVNRSEIQKGAAGNPWTIHTSKACTPAKEVLIRTACATEFRPEKDANPKVFLTCEGVALPLGGGKYVIEG